MKETIKRLLPSSPPLGEEEDRARVAHLLIVIVVTISMIGVVRIILASYVSQMYLYTALRAYAAFFIVVVCVVLMVRRGRIKQACVVFILYQLIAMAWGTYTLGGVTVSMYNFFVFAVMVSGLLLGGRWALGTAFVSVIWGTALLVFEKKGFLPPAVERSPFAAYSTVTPSFVTTAVIVYLYHKDITRALNRARESSAQLLQANQDLHSEVAAREKMERCLAQAQKMEAVGRLAGGIAHDFNNMLVPILGYAELLVGEVEPDSGAHKKVARIRDAAEKAAALTRQILAFSRQQALAPEPLDVNETVVGVYKILRHAIGENIEIQLNLGSALYPVFADKSQIEQVLMNLVLNSKDAMPTGGRVTISTSNISLGTECLDEYDDELAAGDYVLLAVSDTGCGMDQDTLEKIFDPFFTTKASGKGTGLGLATVFGIVKQHQGGIRVFTQLGKGTTFKIYLPRTHLKHKPRREGEPERAASGIGGTVLVAEDDDLVRRVVCEALSSHGFNVLYAHDAPQACKLANDLKSLDLLLTDVVMPGEDGKTLYQRIAEIHPRCKVLYMSGHAMDVVTDHGFLDEGVRLLRKPFKLNQLIQSVQETIAGG